MSKSPSPKARSFLARRAACAATLNATGRRVYLAATLTQVSAMRAESGLSATDRAFMTARLTALLIASQEAA